MSVTLRLFAQAKDAAGTDRGAFEADSVGELLDRAAAAYGDEFAAVLGRSRIWLNGQEPADGAETALVPGDEVAVLPPVSGG